MKKPVKLTIALVLLLSLASFAFAETVTPSETSNLGVTIIYTNDVHTYINNQAKDEGGNSFPLLTYASVAALRNELADGGENVLLVDAGDHVQGTVYGAMDEGENIIDIMNAVGYQAATLGNHEFDYGQYRLFGIMDQADFPYISCNFYSLETSEPVLPSYVILETGGIRVALIGISTPETITSSAPVYFQNEQGEYIFGFYGGEDGSELYNAVQAAIDEIGDSADYIIALGHLGVDEANYPYTSREVITHTIGLDAFIDGHSHTTIEHEEVLDAEGNTVVLTQTGSYLSAIGVMRISAAGISTELITEYDNYDESIDNISKAWVSEVDSMLGERIAVSDIDLFVNNAENTTERLIRRTETNLGDLIADSYYYYFNEIEQINCDMAVANGGGIRVDVLAGEISYTTLKGVQPFGNVLCLMKVSGQQVLDMLEWGCQYIGLTDELGNPAQSGGFLQAAGITYSVDSSISCTVQMDENGLWKAGPSGAYRVHDVKVYNKSTGEYEDLDLEKAYAIAGNNYMLRNLGNGFAMFNDKDLIKDYVGEDYIIVAEYLKAFAAQDDGYSHINTESAPIRNYQGYLLDYENPLGAGRITIK